MRRKTRITRGFTLIEIMVVMLIIALLMTISVIAFAVIMQRTSLETAPTTIQSALQKTRSFAVREHEFYALVFHTARSGEFSGRMKICAVNDITKPTDDDQVGDEIRIGQKLHFDKCPSVCVFRQDGSMVMMKRYPFRRIEGKSYPDASSQLFVTQVKDMIINSQRAPAGNKYYDMKVSIGVESREACYIDLNGHTGRVADYIVGPND